MVVFMPCGPVFPTDPVFLGSRLWFCVRSLDDAVLKYTSVLNKLFAVIRVLEIKFWDLHCAICSVYYLTACYYNVIVGQYITVLLPLSVTLTLLTLLFISKVLESIEKSIEIKGKVSTKWPGCIFHKICRISIIIWAWDIQIKQHGINNEIY